MIVPGKLAISELDILKHVSEEEIARRYVSNFEKVGKPFVSTLRADRRADSCRIFKDISGRLKYKDFADPKIKTQISLFEYIAYKYNESVEDAYERVVKDLNIEITDRDYSNCYELSCNREGRVRGDFSSPSSVIKIKKRDWTSVDKEYWSRYYIPIEMLERNDVKSISNIWIYKEGNLIFKSEYGSRLPSFSYDYYWHEGVFRRKIYRPLVTEYKWTSNSDYTIVQNYPNIPKSGDLLFIQSSMKDCMVMELLGYNAIAPNSEAAWLPEQYWEKLQSRWKKIVIFGNNDWNKQDNPGLRYASTHSQRYGVPFIINPYGEPSDISDYVWKYNLDEGRRLVDSLMKDI